MASTVFRFLLLSLSLSPVLCYYPVTPSNGVHPRLEIRTLAKNADQYSMFVLGMQRFLKTNESAVDSYYRIAGIHGTAIAYDDQPPVQPRGNPGTGYCFHNSQQFVLWHRPYMAIFEQAMIAHAINVANEFNNTQDRTRYLAAARSLRLPYWDWSLDSSVPRELSEYWVWVTDPVKGAAWTENPMLAYTFADPRANPRTTFRGPNYQEAMVNVGSSMRSWTGIMFNTQNVCWNVFASNSGRESETCAPGTIPQYIVSLESIHNAVHNTVCGTMCGVGSAAFDPIFWLHHSNVDRLSALWQAINYNTFLSPTRSETVTFAQAAGTLDANTPLYPFRSANRADAWWTSTGVRDTKSLGYTYPETNNGLTGAALASSVQQRVNELYGTGRTLQALASSTTTKRRSTSAKLRSRAAGPDLTVPPSLNELQPYKDVLVSTDGSFSDYLARVTMKSSAIPISFTLNLYFGSKQASNRAGSISMLSQKSMPQKFIKTDIAITDALLNKLVSKDIDDMSTDVVKSFCRKNLKWQAIGGDGKDYSDHVKVRISIVRNIVRPDRGATLPPVVSPGKQLINVTDTL